ncbi:transmembrane protein 252 [Ochotona princeps]|uniref:transmembrane protein 252 n=1 Tax=Ochotona princeps TaxID=9978 RepID=UPI00271531EE|nr:transmembrane protein 252 [Ochotona princeps]
MRNRTGLLLGVFVLLTGFLMICLGAFFIASGSVFSCWGSQMLAYLLLPLGFGVLLSGIFWSTCRQASKSKGVFSHVLGQHLVQVAPSLVTVDRPDFYPPAYEESTDMAKWSHSTDTEVSRGPPPQYTERSLEFVRENEVHAEAPPAYEESRPAWSPLQSLSATPGHARGTVIRQTLALSGEAC